ncbi:phage portal protein [Paenibacillus sp. GCM10012307]|uniref:Phage portal protein n=1 Tax=Paenibacillus roseus TaxID=2798579 RepID=A0A934J5P4_9BACL|nr:phage portal protein [Paenibacillus roseus]MBJ6360875.1 phage portal protein [Paenibacillus roseus]
MSDLQGFFAQNAVIDTTEEFVVSPRFKDKDGRPIPWKIRSMKQRENEEIRKSATRKIRDKRGGYQVETNSDEYIAKLTVASVVFPPLKDEALQKSYGVLGADKLLSEMLLPGEYADLINKVQELNGFEKDINELVHEVKN